MLAALAGGVGAARFLRGLVRVVPPEEVVAIVNTADDDVFHGLHVSPDLDSVTYTLAGAEHPEQGWGLAGETFAAMDAIERYGVPTWFRLGDRDLATHLHRTELLRRGATLSEATEQIARAIATIVSDGDLRAELSRRGLTQAAKFSIDRYRERVEALYASLR